MGSADEIRPLVEHKLQAMGFELYELRHIEAGRHSVLRVSIDKPAGVTIADCEQASRELSVMLDVEGFSGGPYSLEVSSPGADRPLRTERDFRRAVGRGVVLDLSQAVAGMMRVEGTVQRCADGTVEIQRDGQVLAVPLAAIRSGTMELRFK
jgi:ribosome maturation factor RimP